MAHAKIIFFHFIFLKYKVGKNILVEIFLEAAVSYCKQEKKIKAKIIEHVIGALKIARIQIGTEQYAVCFSTLFCR